MHACILSLSSSGCTFPGIVLSCRLRGANPKARNRSSVRFISVKALSCMCSHSLYLLVYKGEGKGIGIIQLVFQSRKQLVKG
jgi:hypothetical protein